MLISLLSLKGLNEGKAQTGRMGYCLARKTLGSVYSSANAIALDTNMSLIAMAYYREYTTYLACHLT